MSSLRPLLRGGVLVMILVTVACAEGSPQSVPAIEETPAPSPGVAPVVIDTDLGPDDVMAIVFMLQRTDIEVVAVTVSGSGLVHCPFGARNAASLLEHLGRPDVPVACGRAISASGSFPEEWRLAADGLVEDLGLQVDEGDFDGDASHLLVEAIRGSAAPVRLLALGPMTNVADALRLDASLAGEISGIVAMGGAFDVSGSVAPDYTAEWNIWADEDSAREVLASGVPLDLVPLDATNDVPITQFFFETLGPSQGTTGAKLIYRYLATHDFVLDDGSYYFWDPLAAAALVAPHTVTFETKDIAITDRGVTVETADGVPVRVATSADRREFEEEYLTTLNGGRVIPAYIPDPELTVTYTGDGCTVEGATTFDADDSVARVVVELVNVTESSVAVVSGTHEGVGWDQLAIDAAHSRQTGVPPDYWTETGSLTVAGRSLTGGRNTGELDLVPGTHALVCTDDSGGLFLLTDVEVTLPR